VFTTVLGSQARRQLPLGRLGGIFGRALAELLRLDRAAYRRVALGVRAEAPHGVIAVGPTRQRFASRPEPPRVNHRHCRPLLGLGLDPALGEQLGVQRIADSAGNLLDFAVPRSTKATWPAESPGSLLCAAHTPLTALHKIPYS
jgi:hypothetical protein